MKARGYAQWMKAALSLLLLGYLASVIDWRQCAPLAARADLWMMALAVALLTLERALSVLKWWLFLLTRGARVTFWRLFIINYVGGFWGLVLPSSVSADIVRAYYLSRATADLNLTVSSMAVDRSISGLALVAMACVGGWWAGAQPGMEHVRRLVAVLAACSVLCVFVFFRPGWLAGLWQRLPRRLGSWKIARVARDWIASSLEYRKRPGLLLAAFALSLAVQLARVLVFYVVAAGFGLHAPIIYYFVFIPLIMVLIMLPVSFNGIGVREVSFVGFFSMAGMPESGAFVVSLAVSVLTTLTTAVGGVIYMFDRGHSVPPPSGLDAPDDSR